MPIDARRLKELFVAASEVSAPERPQLLDRECAGDAELRARVEALLQAHDAAGSYLAEPAPQATGEFTPQPAGDRDLPRTTDNSPGAHGTIIAGRYTLEQKIGEGGMGEVWVAKQTEPVKRRVALKLIKAGMDSRAVLMRFEQERQALALMDHPNIAKVLDGGLTPTAQPFFVMELVNGLPLTKFCDDAKLGIRERLDLFVPICHAVQHAHQKGIVHRDLKPTNILITVIDGKPVPKVIDFGVAKATSGKLTDASLSTQFGAVVGTLEYMSPEQAGFSGQDVDTRADIYSLGVILYELLTGLRPIDAKRLQKAALSEMLRMIQEEEPSKPSTRLSTDEALPSLAAVRQIEPRKLMAMLRGELDWVVMKCLEKQRDRRYETANGLARDIQRYLADEPIEARAPSAGYKLRKFVRRNKGQVIAACLVLLVLLAGIVGTTIGLIRAERQRSIAEKQRESAEVARRQTQTALDVVTDDSIANLFSKQQKLSTTERQYLSKVLQIYDDLVNHGGTDVEARSIRATGYRRIANIRQQLGEFVEAEATARSAIESFRQLAVEQPNESQHYYGEATAAMELANILEMKHDLLSAVAVLRDAVAAAERANDLQPSDPEIRAVLGACLCDLGFHLARMRVDTEVRELEKRGIEILRATEQAFPNRAKVRFRLATSLSNSTQRLELLGQFVEAEANVREALLHMERLCADEPDAAKHVVNLTITWCNLGDQLKAQKRLAEAEAAYRKGIEIGERAIPRFPSAPNLRAAVAARRTAYAWLLADDDKLERAIELFRKSLADLDVLIADDDKVAEYHVARFGAQHQIARNLVSLTRITEAEPLYRELIERRTNWIRKTPADVNMRDDLAASCMELASLLDARHETVETERLMRQAIREWAEALKLAPETLDFMNNLAVGYFRLANWLSRNGRPVETEDAHRTAKKLATEANALPLAGDREAISLIDANQNLRIELWLHDKRDEAIRCQEEVVAIRQRLLAKKPNDSTCRKEVCVSAAVLTQMLLETKKPNDAEKILQPIVARQGPVVAGSSATNDDLVGFAVAAAVLANVLEARGKADDGLALRRNAIEVRERLTVSLPMNGDNWLALAREASHVGLRMERPQHESTAILAMLSKARAAHEKAIANLGAKPELLIELGGDEVNIANELRASGQAEASLPLFASAIDRLRPLAMGKPPKPMAVQFYCNALGNRALAYELLKRFGDAADDLEKAASLCPVQKRVEYQHQQMRYLAEAGRDSDAIKQVEIVANVEGLAPGFLVDCALVSAIVAKNEKDATIKNDRERRAVELLERARMGGVFRTPTATERIRKEPALIVLRDRDDFKQFLARLSKDSTGSESDSKPSKKP